MKQIGFVVIAFCVFCNIIHASENSVMDKFKWSGDFRFRHEYIDRKDLASNNHRQRLRLRLKTQVQVQENVDVVMQLASGSQDATSTNQSFDGGYSKKTIDIDMAYVNWKFENNMELYVGKIKNTLYSPGDSDILWDSDLTFEGLSIHLAMENYFINGGFFWYEERDGESVTSDSEDTFQYSAQVGFNITPAENNIIKTGLGIHSFSSIQDKEVIGSAKGNLVDGSDRFINDFDIAEFFVSYQMSNTEFYGSYLRNISISNFNNAFLLGVNYGKTKVKGDWLIGYNYRDTESDAVLGNLSDSDFANGETDSRGHKVVGKYSISNSIITSLTFTTAERKISSTKSKYDRGQLDFSFKF